MRKSTETFPKLVKETLEDYGFNLACFTEQLWSEFLSLSAIDYLSERLNSEVVLYIVMTLNSQELITDLKKSVDIDKRVKVQNFQYTLRFRQRIQTSSYSCN